jgi:hypothetical protein
MRRRANRLSVSGELLTPHILVLSWGGWTKTLLVINQRDGSNLHRTKDRMMRSPDEFPQGPAATLAITSTNTAAGFVWRVRSPGTRRS